MSTPGGWCRRTTRIAIWLRDDRRCVYCDQPLALHEATLDHLTPRSAGGSNSPRNLVTCCRSCNSARGDLPLDGFAGDPERIRRQARRRLARCRKAARALELEEQIRARLYDEVRLQVLADRDAGRLDDVPF